MNAQKEKTPVQTYREIESLISGTSSLTDNEKQALSLENVFALLSNCEIVDEK